MRASQRLPRSRRYSTREEIKTEAHAARSVEANSSPALSIFGSQNGCRAVDRTSSVDVIRSSKERMDLELGRT